MVKFSGYRLTVGFEGFDPQISVSSFDYFDTDPSHIYFGGHFSDAVTARADSLISGTPLSIKDEVKQQLDGKAAPETEAEYVAQALPGYCRTNIDVKPILTEAASDEVHKSIDSLVDEEFKAIPAAHLSAGSGQ
jgi:hypothetical protein